MHVLRGPAWLSVAMVWLIVLAESNSTAGARSMTAEREYGQLLCDSPLVKVLSLFCPRHYSTHQHRRLGYMGRSPVRQDRGELTWPQQERGSTGSTPPLQAVSVPQAAVGRLPELHYNLPPLPWGAAAVNKVTREHPPGNLLQEETYSKDLPKALLRQGRTWSVGVWRQERPGGL